MGIGLVQLFVLGNLGVGIRKGLSQLGLGSKFVDQRGGPG